MTRTRFILALMTVACTSLSAATVSIVNQTQGTTVPSGTVTVPSTVPQTVNQYNQGQKTTTGPALGKLPPSSPSSVKGGHPPRKAKLESQEIPRHAETPVYTYPGLVARLGRRWIGNDYLYNMHRNIGVKVEVVKQEGKDISIDEEGLSLLVADIFQRGEIVPEALASENEPPLPFFHILIFALPSDNLNIAFVSGRLFEDALLARYGLDPIGTWQAISWEKQDLVVTSPLQFDEQLKKSVANIAETFVNRVEMYAKIKEEAESNAKLYYPSVIPAQPAPKITSKPVPKGPIIERIPTRQ